MLAAEALRDGREHHHGQMAVRWLAAEPVEHLETVEDRQRRVEHGDIGALSIDLGEGGLAVVGLAHVVAGGFER
jgi:hypothetical protein